MRKSVSRKSPEFLHHCRARLADAPSYRLALPPLAAVVLLGGAGQPAPQRLYQAYSDQEKADLDKISAYLNAIHSLKASFVQIGPEGGMDQGSSISRSRARSALNISPPSPLLIVATGGSVYVKNSRLNTVDHYDLSDTPLGLLLNENVDLKTNKAVLGVAEQNGAIIVQARTSTNRNNSNITLVFSSPGHRAAAMDGEGQSGRQHHRGAAEPADRRRPGSGAVRRAGKGAAARQPRKQADEDASASSATAACWTAWPVHQANDEYVTAMRDGAGALPLLIPSTDAPLDIGADAGGGGWAAVHRRAVQCRASHYGAERAARHRAG